MSIALQLLHSTKQQLLDWSWFKRTLLVIALLTFMTSSFLFLTRPGTDIRIWMAQTVIITQHRDWAWMFVGAQQRDEMVKQMHQFIEDNAAEKQQFGLIKHQQTAINRKNRSIDELIKVEDISGKLWKGKRMYVFDPKTIRLMTPEKKGEGEKITSMVKRTGAVAGVNGGGFDDPEGLGNGFAAIGAIISSGDIIYTDQESSTPQHIVGFTKDGTLVIGKYNMIELREMGISEAASFYPRVIANGKPLPISDGSRAPRTAVGQKADGTVIFIVIDGRQTHSVGATLKEVQDMFLADDVINAGFLDGGASSELVVNGELVTKPSSRYGERRLPSAFLVYDHPEDAVANRVWDGVDKIDAGGSYDHPDFLKEQAELKAKQRNNPTPAVTPNTTKTTETDKPKTTEPSNTKTGTTKTNAGSEAVKPPSGSDAKATEGSKTNTTTPAHGASSETTVPKTAPAGTGTESAVPPASGATGTGVKVTPTSPGAAPANGASTQGDSGGTAPTGAAAITPTSPAVTAPPASNSDEAKTNAPTSSVKGTSGGTVISPPAANPVVPATPSKTN